MDKHIPKEKHKTIPYLRLTNEIKIIQQQYNTLLNQVNHGQWTQGQRNRLRELQENLVNLQKRQDRDVEQLVSIEVKNLIFTAVFLVPKIILYVAELGAQIKKKKKIQILHVSKNRPLPININGTVIPYTGEAKLLGLKLIRTIKERLKLAQRSIRKLKRFTAMTPKVKLHLCKVMVAPHLAYPPVPLNTLK